MALTPDDVVEKVFPTVRFKDGYDPDEIDDYLDEVVIEWRKTLEENAALKARVAELEAAAESAPVAAVPVAEPVAAPVSAAPATDSSAASDVEQVARIITTAQRVHDEIVAEGETRRDELIGDAEARATQIITEAENRKREEIESLTTERASLETKIDELREFESAYRSHLRTYFELQLRELEAEPSHAASVQNPGQ